LIFCRRRNFRTARGGTLDAAEAGVEQLGGLGLGYRINTAMAVLI
jgi:hypothetical protein